MEINHREVGIQCDILTDLRMNNHIDPVDCKHKSQLYHSGLSISSIKEISNCYCFSSFKIFEKDSHHSSINHCKLNKNENSIQTTNLKGLDWKAIQL